MGPPSSLDALRKAFDGIQLRGWISLPVQCSAPWVIPIPIAHASFYGMLDGECRLDAGEMNGLTLRAGDFVIIKEGTPGRLFDNHESADRPHARRTTRIRKRSASHRIRRAQLLCGGFTPREGGTTSLLITLPPVVRIDGNHAKFAPSIDDLLRMMLAESAHEHPETSVILDRLVSILVIKAIRQARISSDDGTETILNSCADAEVATALDRIHQRPDCPWTVARLAAEVQLSRSTFSARFLVAVGKTPWRYLRDFRMQTASRFLEEGQCPLKQIAAKTGYRTSSAFSNAFKRWTGSSPDEYRRRHQPSGALRPNGR
jgi:AraC-like DNA-binding protein